MNIVVLAGGNSTERDVSISSGEGVCSALRQKNHKAVLVDVYFGKESFGEELFPEVYDVKAEADSMREMSKLVEETGKTRMYFLSVKQQISYFLPCMEQMERTEKYSLSLN